MRLLYLQPSPSFGMHQYTADLANRMSELHDTYLCTTKGYPADRYAPGLKIFTPLEVKTTGFSLEVVKIPQIRSVVKLVNKISPDVVHISGPHLWNLYWVKTLQSKGIPIIHTIHDMNPHPGMRFGSLLRFWNKKIVQSAGHILVHGDRFKEEIIRGGLNEDRVSSLPLLHLFLGYEGELRVESQMPVLSYGEFILFFGRIRKYKGLDQLLKAFVEITDRFKQKGGKPIKLLIVGAGSITDFWSKAIPESVEVYEGQASDDEAVGYFSNCSMVVLPYIEASQSAVIASAYYFKKPVLATRVGAFDEYVQEGITGRLIEPGNSRALQEGIFDMAADQHGLRTMGEAGRQWYDHQRTEEHKCLIQLYEKARTTKSVFDH